MGLRQKITRNLFAGLVMVAGCTMLFALLVVMNARNHPPKRIEQKKDTVVAVARKKQPPKTRKRVARRRPRKAASRPRAPIPTLGSGISGNSFGIPSLAGAAIADTNSAGLLDQESVRDMVMTEDAVDQPPRPIERIRPAYPPRARVQGVTGKVTLGLLIGAEGRVVKVKVLDAQPPGVFDTAALEAIRNWRFEPARYKAQAVKVWARQTVKFDLT